MSRIYIKIVKKIKSIIVENYFFYMRKIYLQLECVRYSKKEPESFCFFWIVSCERNIGEAAIKCLDSVYHQKYPGEKIGHLFIDDASTDGTDDKIRRWLEGHPDHNVQFIAQPGRMGGTANTVMGFRMAPPNSIVLELNGDDWLPDDSVLDFLNRVYADPEVWMTYNTFMFSDGSFRKGSRPYPRRIVKNRDYRNYQNWLGQPLHSFRSELFAHLKEDTFSIRLQENIGKLPTTRPFI